jgi:hypothetical protein
MIQTLFRNKDAVFQEENLPIHTAETLHLWFEEHEGELQHLPWPTQSPGLNIIEPLWSVLETRVRNRFLPPTSVKQHEDVLQEEWYKIPLETVQNVYESIPRMTAAVLKAKVVRYHNNEEMCKVSVVPPLFGPTPVCTVTCSIFQLKPFDRNGLDVVSESKWQANR